MGEAERGISTDESNDLNDEGGGESSESGVNVEDIASELILSRGIEEKSKERSNDVGVIEEGIICSAGDGLVEIQDEELVCETVTSVTSQDIEGADSIILGSNSA